VGRSRTETEGKASSRGSADTTGEADTESETHTDSRSDQSAQTKSRGLTITVSAAEDGDIRAVIEGRQEGEAITVATSATHADSSSKAHTETRSHTDNIMETVSSSTGLTDSNSSSRGGNTSANYAFGRQRGKTYAWSNGRTWESNRSHGTTRTRSTGQTVGCGYNSSVAVTDQPGVRHTPIWEEQPEFWSLEEQRWRASELIMEQPVGHCVMRTATGQLGLASIPLPPQFCILPKALKRLSQELYRRYCLTKEEAEQLLCDRQAQLRDSVRQTADSADVITNGCAAISGGVAAAGPPLWNREVSTAGASRDMAPSPATITVTTAPVSQRTMAPRRGPKPDRENHAKVEEIVGRYGTDWTKDSSLPELCAELDRARIPIPKHWPLRIKSRSWSRALENDRNLVVKAIKDRLKAAAQIPLAFEGEFPKTSA
jgi:hypothetical protein